MAVDSTEHVAAPQGCERAAVEQVTAPEPGVEIRYAGTWEQLITIVPAWTELVEQVRADAFARPQFAIPCWTEAARGAAVVAQAWRGRELIALAPLWVSRFGRVPVARTLGSSPTSRASLLVRPGEQDVLGELVTALTRDAGLVVAHDRARQVPVPAGGARRPIARLRTWVLDAEVEAATGDGPVVIEDADRWQSMLRPTGWTQSSLPGVTEPDEVLVQTVVDGALRSKLAMVVSDGWRGAAVWLLGTTSASLWCSAGSCAPGGSRWHAGLAAAGEWARARGVDALELPGAPAAVLGLPAGVATARRPDVTVVARSPQALTATRSVVALVPSLRREVGR